MKKLRVLGFLLIAFLAVALSSAFTANTAKADPDPEYYWYDDFGYTQRHLSVELEEEETECPNTGNVICERGYSADDFNTTGVPASGLKDDAEPEEFIMREN